MTQELLYTSAPRGLKAGSRGFCTVVSTRSMSAPLATALESLSGYRPVFPPGDPQAALNPVVWSHLKLTVAGRPASVLSRISDYGLDYSQRTNKLAHHVVLDPAERTPPGPAWLLEQPGFLQDRWDGELRTLTAGRAVPRGEVTPGVCTAWERLTGDAGWAGVLAEAFLADPQRQVYLIFEPGMDLLPLIAEAIALLPRDQRWEVTFSTYFTSLPPGTTCNWRCVLKDSPEANQSRRFVQALRINLCEPLERATGGRLVELARTGAPARADDTRTTAAENFDEAEVVELEADAPGLTPPPLEGETYSLSTRPGAPPPPPPRKHRRRLEDLYAESHARSRGRWKIAATALMLLLLLGAGYVLFRYTQNHANLIAEATSSKGAVQKPEAVKVSPPASPKQLTGGAQQPSKPTEPPENATPPSEQEPSAGERKSSKGDKPASDPAPANTNPNSEESPSQEPESPEEKRPPTAPAPAKQPEQITNAFASPPTAVNLSGLLKRLGDEWKGTYNLGLPAGDYRITVHGPPVFSTLLIIANKNDSTATISKQATVPVLIAELSIINSNTSPHLHVRYENDPNRSPEIFWCAICIRDNDNRCRKWFVLQQLPIDINTKRFANKRLRWNASSLPQADDWPNIQFEQLTVRLEQQPFQFEPANPSSTSEPPTRQGRLNSPNLRNYLKGQLKQIPGEPLTADIERLSPEITWKLSDKHDAFELQLIKDEAFWRAWQESLGNQMNQARPADTEKVILPKGSLYEWFTKQNPRQITEDATKNISFLTKEINELGGDDSKKNERDRLNAILEQHKVWQQSLPKAKDLADFIKLCETTLPKAEVAAARMYYEIEIDGEPRRIYVIDYSREK